MLDIAWGIVDRDIFRVRTGRGGAKASEVLKNRSIWRPDGTAYRTVPVCYESDRLYTVEAMN